MPNHDRVKKRKREQLSEAAAGSDVNVMKKFISGKMSQNWYRVKFTLFLIILVISTSDLLDWRCPGKILCLED